MKTALSKALEHSLKILELFQAEAADVLSFTDIAERIDAPRTSLFRLVRTLEDLHYLRRDPDKGYRLGSRVMLLGFSFLASQDIVDIARPELLQLRKDVGCATYLAILEGPEFDCLSAYPMRGRTASVLTVGSRFPAHATPMGRTLLAYQPKTYLRTHFGKCELTKYTDATPANLLELETLLEADRERGYVLGQV